MIERAYTEYVENHWHKIASRKTTQLSQVWRWDLQQDNAAGYGYPPVNAASLRAFGLVDRWALVLSFFNLSKGSS